MPKLSLKDSTGKLLIVDNPLVKDMTMLDELTGQAMQGLLACESSEIEDTANVAGWAHNYAEAVLIERHRRKQIKTGEKLGQS